MVTGVSAKINCLIVTSFLADFRLSSCVGGSVSRYPDGQLAMRAFDNGAGHACSDAMQFSMFSVCRLGLILFTVTNCI